MLGKDSAKPSCLAAFVANEQLHLVKVEKLEHIETVEELFAKNELGDLFRELGLADARGAQEQDTGLCVNPAIICESGRVAEN